MASKHVASISPLNCFFFFLGGGRGFCCQHWMPLCAAQLSTRCAVIAPSPVPLANGKEHLVCKLVSHWGGCGLGTGLEGWSGGRAGWGGRGAGEASSGRCLCPSVVCLCLRAMDRHSRIIACGDGRTHSVLSVHVSAPPAPRLACPPPLRPSVCCPLASLLPGGRFHVPAVERQGPKAKLRQGLAMRLGTRPFPTEGPVLPP